MLNNDSIKALAKRIKRPMVELVALTPTNDPFCADVGYRRVAAEWFQKIWAEHGTEGGHLRRIHYILVSSPFLLPTGREYQNTLNDWTYLCTSSLSARYLDLIPFDALEDRRNDEAIIFADGSLDPNAEQHVSYSVSDAEPSISIPEMPELPWLFAWGMHESARQDFVVEVWIEKSTQNDWLVPLCRKRGVNLVVGIGESSEIRSRELAERSAKYAVPTRIIYISDFDPGGRSMPKAVARKVEFTLRKFDLDCDLQLIPLALTPEQCRQYKLPRTPIKETEQRKDKFEETFGAGATELDALEALYPGELARLLTAELDNFLDATLEGRLQSLKREMQGGLRAIEDEIHAEHSEEIDEIAEAIDELAEQLSSLKERASELWKTIARELWEKSPRCRTDEVEFPRSEAPGETESFVLFDSKRSYLEQMDFYNAWKAGDE